MDKLPGTIRMYAIICDGLWMDLETGRWTPLGDLTEPCIKDAITLSPNIPQMAAERFGVDAGYITEVWLGPATLFVVPTPPRSERAITMADLCAREGLSLPASVQANPGLLRGYKAPKGSVPTWTLTNTGGRRYRLDPTTNLVDRYRGSRWEDVPPHNIPLIIMQLRQALGLTTAQEDEHDG